jgi:hypothetical protein
MQIPLILCKKKYWRKKINLILSEKQVMVQVNFVEKSEEILLEKKSFEFELIMRKKWGVSKNLKIVNQ